MAFRLRFDQLLRDPDGVEGSATISPEVLAQEAATGATVPDGLKLVAGWTWRVLVICAGVYVLGQVVSTLSEVLIPLFLALLLTAALWPVKTFLQARHVPRVLAVICCLLLLLGLVVGIFTLVGTQIASQANSLTDAAVASYQQFMNWLGNGPLHLQREQIEVYTKQATTWARQQQSAAGSYAAEAGTQMSHFFAGLALALFALFYFLYEGRSFARLGFGMVPKNSRARFEDASLQGWVALVSYVRAAIVVAAVDGLGAGIGAAAVGSNLFLAIGSLTFLSAFIPLLGAFISGVVATSVVLLTLGMVRAVIMLVVFVAVMEIEAHVLQPFLLGKAVSIHPLVVLYGIAIGTIVNGMIGALFAVPLMAFGNAFVRALSSHATWSTQPASAASAGVDDGAVPDPEPVNIDDLPPGPEAMAAVMEASAEQGTLPEMPASRSTRPQADRPSEA